MLYSRQHVLERVAFFCFKLPLTFKSCQIIETYVRTHSLRRGWVSQPFGHLIRDDIGWLQIGFRKSTFWCRDVNLDLPSTLISYRVSLSTRIGQCSRIDCLDKERSTERIAIAQLNNEQSIERLANAIELP